MADNRTQLIVEAIDRASNVLQEIDGKIDRLGQSSDRLGTQFGVAAFAGEVAFKAVDLAIQGVTASVGFFIDNLQKAAEVQTGAIATAANIGAIVGGSVADNLKIVQQLTDSVVEQTSALPGLTQAYQEIAQTIFDNVIPAAKDADGVLNPDKLVQYTTEITRAFGLLGQGVGLSSQSISLGLGRALGGQASVAELSRIDLFERNPALLGELKKELTARGVEELKELSESARVDVLRKLGNQFITDDVVNSFTQTFNGQIEGFMSQLFDPNSGVFGFAKKLSGRGDASIIDAATVVLDQIFVLFGQIAQISYDAFGFTATDVTEAIYDFVVFLGDIASAISVYITNPENQQAITERLQAIGNLIQQMRDYFGDLFNLVSNVVEVVAALLAVIIDFADFIGGLLSGNEQQVEAAKARLSKSIPDLFSKITDAISGFIDFVATSITDTFNKIKNFFQTAASALTASANAASVNTGTSTVSNTVTVDATSPLSDTSSADIVERQGRLDDLEAALGVGNSYAGQIPAIETERAMIPGASPVIANSSEYILTPQQMQNLVSGMMVGGGFNPTINIAGSADKATIDHLMVELDKRWQQYRSTYTNKIQLA